MREEAGKAAYVSFDDPLQRQFAVQDPNGFLNQFGTRRVVLDEVQYVPELFSYLKLRIDTERERWAVCRVDQPTRLPGGPEAMSWREFPRRLWNLLGPAGSTAIQLEDHR